MSSMPAYSMQGRVPRRPPSGKGKKKRPDEPEQPREPIGGIIASIVIVVVAFSMIAVLLYAQSRVTALQVEIRSLKSQISQEQNLQSRYKLQSDAYTDITYIIRRATELGLREPEFDEYIYLR
ncbi:MAG: hypothetical protein ACOX17_05340 [Christensenellales bacterium]|jgi:hypothetical protein